MEENNTRCRAINREESAAAEKSSKFETGSRSLESGVMEATVPLKNDPLDIGGMSEGGNLVRKIENAPR